MSAFNIVHSASAPRVATPDLMSGDKKEEISHQFAVVELIFALGMELNRGGELADLAEMGEALADLIDPDRTATELKTLGEGSYGTVFKLDKSIYGEIALKIFNYDTAKEDSQSKITRLTKHRLGAEAEGIFLTEGVPNTVRTIAVVAADNFGSLRIYDKMDLEMNEVNGETIVGVISEYVKSKDMQEKLDDGEELDIPKTFHQIAQALVGIHEKGGIYRDVKPENILIDDEGNAHLTDFGFAKRIKEDGRTYSMVGSLAFMAPEVLKVGCDNAPEERYNQKVDVYSLGCSLYLAEFGKIPYESGVEGEGPDMKLMNNIADGNIIKPDNFDQSNQLHALIWEMMEYDRRDRPTMAKVAARLSVINETQNEGE